MPGVSLVCGVLIPLDCLCDSLEDDAFNRLKVGIIDHHLALLDLDQRGITRILKDPLHLFVEDLARIW